MSKNNNIVCHLNNQSIHGTKVDRKISKSFLKSTNRQYKCTWKRNLRHGFSYDGNMYIGAIESNFYQYFQGCFTPDNEPCFLRTRIERTNATNNIGTEAGWRIRDTLVYECPVTRTNDAEGLSTGHYEKCLYALTSSSYIIQYLLRPGCWAIENNVYLGRFSFSHLNYDSQLERFVVKSKHFPHDRNSDVRLYFALFETAPFKFKAAFPIKKSVFGTIKDAFVINGLIVTLSSECYSFYSLEHVLEHCLFHICDFGDTVSLETDINNLGSPPTDSSVVGKYPYGIPVNVQLDAKPPLLFQLSSANISGLSFGGFPWFCLGSHHDRSKLYRVRTGKEVGVLNHGKYMFPTLDDEKKAYFHSDRSGRILCIEYDEIKCLRILDTPSNDGVTFHTCYSIQYGQDIIQQQRPHAKRSRSGRAYKPVIARDCTTLPSEIVHALDYDNILDVLAVLHTRVTSKRANNKYAITLYDNLSGNVIRTFDLETDISDNDAYEWNIFLNDLMIICTLRFVGSGNSMNTVFTYQMIEEQFVTNRCVAS